MDNPPHCLLIKIASYIHKKSQDVLHGFITMIYEVERKVADVVSIAWKRGNIGHTICIDVHSSVLIKNQ